MIQRSLYLVLVAAFLVLATLPGLTQVSGQGGGQAPGTAVPPAKSFLPPQGQRSAPGPEAAGPLHSLYAWLTAWQADINRRLATAVREIRTGNPVTATFFLAALSFAYGVLHAAGPGHGKAVISSYVLANERTVRRGIALSFLAALIQGLSALMVVCILVLVLKATGLTMKATEAWLETASWALVAAVGAWLLWRQLRSLRAPVAAHAHEHHHHGHVHRHHAHGHDHGHHAHDHSCCDHAHIPDPKQLEGAWSWRKALPIALAVGVRPCTGAILVLVFAIGQGLLWAGVFATFAMALGTAITVSALAALAVGSRELAVRIGNGGGGERVRLVAGIGGSALVMAMGIVLFIGSLNNPAAF
ncbi:MAG: nickel/cobalt transporter [Rhodospirillales bacterium]|nr:nickel/cobalt transporter [Rhodospirillales bacterium]